jgi:hypothetical protein
MRITCEERHVLCYQCVHGGDSPVKIPPSPDLSGGASTTNSLVFTADGNHNFYALNVSNDAVIYCRNDQTGGNAGVNYLTWGAPSIVNGKLFVTTLGSSTNGLLEAWGSRDSEDSVIKLLIDFFLHR